MGCIKNMKIKYQITFQNEDGSPWHLGTHFENEFELNDYIQMCIDRGSNVLGVKIINIKTKTK